ncbi:MAG: polyphosphate kinase 1 [Gemmatimonas sp.]|nr:polyphosphate kinase 1 [Gemmatimonas sp.]
MTVHEGPSEAPPATTPKRSRKRSPIVPIDEARAVAPRPVPKKAPLDHPALYFNHELGWLDFDWRVLHQALDERLPLLERVRFLSITYSNLDEFYQKRVGGLKRQQAAGVTRLSYDGRTPGEQLRLVTQAALEIQAVMSRTWNEKLRPVLRKRAGILISDYGDLTAEQRESVDRHFFDQIYPVLTPLAVDPGHPFPFISNLSLSLAVGMRHPDREALYFARLKVPPFQKRWLRVEPSEIEHHYVPIEQVIARNISGLFRGMEIVSVHPFRVTRNADLDRFEEEAEDLVAMISDELRERRSAPVVRLEIDQRTPKQIRQLLLRELELDPSDVVDVRGPLNLGDLAEIAELNLPGFTYAPWTPTVPPRLAHEGETEEDQDIFSIIRRGDILVHHPYESFNASVQRLLDEAADDPHVLAIKQTLYRTSPNSPIVRALLRAAEKGKQVAVLVEVKARFDEASNIEWAQILENAGVHVTYGLVGLKTHAKVLLIIRQEGGSPQAYCHIGTGNYHAGTAQVYSDIGLLTADSEIGREAIQLFNSITGHAPDQSYERLIVAPRNMRRIYYELIRREIVHQEKNGNGRIVAKMNALDDAGIIQELYRASQAGVRIDLIVRGHSRLRPGLPGYSDNIRIVSIIGRFLEHDRVYWFGNGGESEVFVGSADWRQRNLSERVEVVVPVLDEIIRQRLITFLEHALADNRLAFDLNSEGQYVQRRPASGEPQRDFHEVLMTEALERRGSAGAT